jgi:DNA-binding NarL/FixJ family response regulator
MAFQSVNFLSDPNRLTHRELDVLHLVCKGFTSQEISDKLFISMKTVEAHRTNLFHKSDVRNSGELIVWAIKNNYFSIE